MAKSKIDRLLDKTNLTKEDMEYIRDYYQNKGIENLNEHEFRYLEIAKTLLAKLYKDESGKKSSNDPAIYTFTL